MSKKTIEERYKKLTPEEQVLKRPDTYVGAVILQDKSMWCANKPTYSNDIKITKQDVTYTPALLKLYDEILTNASDHANRDKTNVKNIKINIDDEWNISIYNDGSGIPIVKHKEHNIYVPELIFCHLFSGENYDDDNDFRYGAGRNGLGSKLVSIFSDKFIIDCADGKKKYYQTITNNNKNKEKPKISPSKKSYTCITYKADFNRLQLGDKSSEESLMKLFIKRAIDIAVYNPSVNVYFNDTLINISNMEDWCKLHINNDEIFIEKFKNFSIALTHTPTHKFEQCSIVNGNTTWDGGTYIDGIMKQLYTELIVQLTKGKKGIKLKPNDIKSKFHIFVIAKIANPVFDTQTKEKLTLKTELPKLPTTLYKKLLKSTIIESILQWIELKEQQALKKINNKSAGKSIRVPKLLDAHKAGTINGYKSALCITEGDSALGTVVSGLSVVGRDYYGAYPIRGRILNVRNVKSLTEIGQSELIANLMKIIGLIPGKKYTSLKELRYGKLIFFTDADDFGLSIKGLLINFIHKMWPELIKLGICYEFITPVVKATKNKKILEYYNLQEYHNALKENKLNGYKIKYYKGLGTINKNEIKEMFKNLNKHLIQFKFDNDDDLIDMIFNKDRVQERKDWLVENQVFKPVPDKKNGNYIKDFINTEFVQFAHYDNIISIPKFEDGLKPSQRKILFGAFKKNLKTTPDGEIKVAQFGSYVAEQTHFAHGETNMHGTIIGMAQNFIGSNNIDLLKPSGNFGSRKNPKASASPRYIFTYLNHLTKLIFNEQDEEILEYNYEDGDKIEPKFYLPIIPMLMVNGAAGIGTGWSTDIPKYDPKSIIKIITKKLKNPNTKYKITPHYNNWNGTIEFDKNNNKYITSGIYSINNTKRKIHITELPINMSTDKYIEHLDKLLTNKIIKKITDNCTDEIIDITIDVDTNFDFKNILKILKLTTSLSLNNMHSFKNDKITKYDTIEELLNDWIDFRLPYYSLRKESQIQIKTDKYNKYYNIVCFLNAVMKDVLIINKRPKSEIIKDLEQMDFLKIDNSYNYLLNIPIYHFSKEKYDEYKQLALDIKNDLESYKLLKPEEIWISELSTLNKNI